MGDELREALLTSAAESDREAAESRRAMTSSERQRLATLAGILREDPPPPPPTAEEVENTISERQARVEQAWSRIEDYIVGLTCPATHFTITNGHSNIEQPLRVCPVSKEA
jgi:hypothetical protein